MILPQNFYNRGPLKVAQDLLGCFLVRRFDGKTVILKIVETEAYNGQKDLACHASRGKTLRNEVMFGPPGFFYVYFTYGLHYMLNIVTGPDNFPSAVLIRALEPAGGKYGQIRDMRLQSKPKSDKLFSGPAKLTKALRINKTFNRLPAFKKSSKLWVESGTGPLPSSGIIRTSRIGIDYAGNYKDKKWRYYIKDNPFISRI